MNHRGHGKLLVNKSFFEVENVSVNSVVYFKCIFWVKIKERIETVDRI